MTFRDYLIQNELLPIEGEALVLARKAYQKQYLKRYKQIRKQTHKRVEITFTLAEFNTLEKQAKYFGATRASFCKAMVLERLLQLPLRVNATAVSQLQLEIRKIGNLVNALVRKVHTRQHLYSDDLRQLYQKIASLENLIVTKLDAPKFFDHAHQNTHSQGNTSTL